MNYYSDTFSRMMHMYVGTNVDWITEYPTFYHVSSRLSSAWYNFIVPQVNDVNNLDQTTVIHIGQTEKDFGTDVGLYINQSILDNYQTFLQEKKFKLIGNETYLTLTTKDKVPVELPQGYTISSEYNINNVIDVLKKCFPDWPEEKDYSNMYEQYKLTGQEDRIFETFCVYFENQIVGAASISIDQNLNLGYLHNDGIINEHRRKGLHTALINVRNNFGLEYKITDMVTIVDDKANSFPSFLKSGFQIADKFYLYSR